MLYNRNYLVISIFSTDDGTATAIATATATAAVIERLLARAVFVLYAILCSCYSDCYCCFAASFCCFSKS